MERTLKTKRPGVESQLHIHYLVYVDTYASYLTFLNLYFLHLPNSHNNTNPTDHCKILLKYYL